MYIIEFISVLFVLGIIILLLLKILCSAKTRYVDRSWQGWNIESYKFNVKDGHYICFVIFTGLGRTISFSDGLDLEAELEDIGVLPYSYNNNKQNTNYYLLDRNNGNKYIYKGKSATIKFERV